MATDPTPEPVAEFPQRRIRVERSDRELTLDYSMRQWAPGCFLSVFFIAWSAACATIVAHAAAARDPFMWLFATPFLAAWCFLMVAVHQTLFGWERLRVGPNGMIHEHRGIVGFRRRELPLAEVQAFDVAKTIV